MCGKKLSPAESVVDLIVDLMQGNTMIHLRALTDMDAGTELKLNYLRYVMCFRASEHACLHVN